MNAAPCAVCAVSSALLAKRWRIGLKKAAKLTPLKKTLAKAQKGEPLELDELWSFVARRSNKRWVWLAQCRRTRQIVAYCTGRPGRCHWWSQRNRLRFALVAHPKSLQEKLTRKAYKKGLLYTDFWSAYALVLPAKRHRATGKGAGQTCHPNKASHWKVQQHFAPAVGPLCPPNAFVLEDRSDARDMPALFLHQHNNRPLA